jgi:GWxTD domain-containing protein
MKHLKVIHVIFLFMLYSLNCSPRREIKFEPNKEGLYEAIQLIMTGSERKILNRLPDEESREEYMREFWEKRDPDLSTKENEFKEEFERRLAYANLHFQGEGKPGWKTDRGRIYIYLGPPDQVYQEPYLNYSNLKGRILWVYYRYRLGVEFLDRTGSGMFDMRIDSSHSFRLLEAIDRAKFGLIYGDEAQLGKKSDGLEVEFDSKKKEIVVRIPSTALLYKEESGYFLVDLRFDFYIYSDDGIRKERFSKNMNFKELKDEVLKMDDIIFTIPYELEAGTYYMDVKVSDSEGIGQFRKIVKVRIKKS